MENDNKKAFAVANHLIKTLHENDIHDVTNLKLQKLMYFAYGIYLSIYNGERLFDSPIQAWRLGPVVPSIYSEFKDYGSNPIGQNSRARILKNDYTGELITPDESYFDDPEKAIQCLAITCVAYGKRTSWDLVNITHTEKTSAWARVYDPSKRGLALRDDDIVQEFKPYIRAIEKNLAR
jgi:uncharacterized phage-associated protein